MIIRFALYALGTLLLIARLGAAGLSEDRIRIAVLYRSSLEGEQHWRGACAALDAHPDRSRFYFEPIPYATEDEAVLELAHLLRGSSPAHTGTWDIVLGPTDSGVFVRAHDQEMLLDEHLEVPVVSSLVTANVPQSETGWFFRTNKDVEQRAFAIYDILNKRLVDSSTIIYEDNEFGRRAERAYKTEFIRDNRASDYHSIPFNSDEEARTAAREILDTRPESVGIFGQRRAVALIYRSIEDQKRDLLPFEPLFFSILDLSLVKDQLEEFYFVSTTKRSFEVPEERIAELRKSLALEQELPSPRPASERQPSDLLIEDVFALSYDTTCLVLDIASTQLGWDALAFRRDLASVLQSGKSSSQGTVFEGLLTGMKFADFRNDSELTVLHAAGGEGDPNALQVLRPRLELGAREQIEFKIGLVLRRFGYLPFLIVGLLAAASYSLSFRDIRLWYGGGRKAILRSAWFHAFAAFNLMVVVGLYVFLAQTGRVAYDSFLAAGLIALGPSAVFKSSWFESPEGNAYGPRQLYEKVMLWFNEHLTAELFWDRPKRENILVHFNSLPFLVARVEDIYRRMRPASRSGKLLAEFSKARDKTQSNEEERRVCVDHLLRYLSWGELVEKGCVPASYEQLRKADDPLSIVKKICGELSENRIGSLDLEPYIQVRLKNVNAKTREYYEARMKEPNHERGALFTQVQFLHLKLNMHEGEFEDHEGLRADIQNAREELASAAFASSERGLSRDTLVPRPDSGGGKGDPPSLDQAAVASGSEPP